LIIVGDNASEVEIQSAKEIADYLENKPLIKRYSKITEEDRKRNLIVVGTPSSNSMLKEIYAMADVLEVNETFPGKGKGILEILRNPWNKEKGMLLVEGWKDDFLSHFFEVTEYFELLNHRRELIPLDYLGKIDSITLEKAMEKEKIMVYLYFAKKPNFTQIKELEKLGISIDLEHWISPVGSHPYGFLPAEIPDVARLKYIIKISSAEIPYKFPSEDVPRSLPVEYPQPQVEDIKEVGK